MRMFLLPIVVLAVLLAGQAALCEEAAVKSPEAIRVIDRAVQVAAELKEYSADTTRTMLTRHDEAEDKPMVRVGRVSFRAPGYLWSATEGGKPGDESIKLADGRMQYQFFASRPRVIEKKDIAGLSSVALAAYPELELSSLSPLTGQVIGLARSRAQESARLTYQGREVVGGVLCDTVEVATPQKSGSAVYRYSFGVGDALLRRQVGTSVNADGSKTFSEERYTVRKPDSAEHFTFARLETAVKPFIKDGAVPAIEEAYVAVGQSLPDIPATLAKGGALRWKDYEGKVLVVETWATWCVFCKQAMPFYERMRREVADQGVVFLALSFDEQQALYDNWVKDNRERYGFVFARAEVTGEDWKEKMDRFKGGLPAFYVVGRDGKVVAAYSGYGYGKDKEDPRLRTALAKAGVATE